VHYVSALCDKVAKSPVTDRLSNTPFSGLFSRTTWVRWHQKVKQI